MSFAFGNVLENLKDSKDKLATQDFEDTMLAVNEEAQEKTTLFGDIEKGSGTALGTIVGAKAFASQVQKLRQKFKGSNKEESNENEDEGGVEGVEEGAEGVEAEIPEENIRYIYIHTECRIRCNGFYFSKWKKYDAKFSIQRGISTLRTNIKSC